MIPGHGAKAMLLLACAMLAGCAKASPSPGSATVLLTPRPTLTVTGLHNGPGGLAISPLGTADGAAIARLQWTAPSLQVVEVLVSAGDQRKVFARGWGSGDATARFLTPGHQYVFELRSVSTGRLLASTVVQVR